MTLTNFIAKLFNRKKFYLIIFDKVKMILVMNDPLNNCFLIVGNSISKQRIGIQMCVENILFMVKIFELQFKKWEVFYSCKILCKNFQKCTNWHNQ